MAIATNKVGSLGLLTGAFIKYFKSGKVQWKVVMPFSFVGLFAGVLGAHTLLSIDTEILNNIIAVIILLMLILILTKRKVGLEHRQVGKRSRVFGYVCYFLAMMWGAFFGGGYGILVMYSLTYLFGFTMIESAATSKIPGFVMGLSAVTVYALNGAVYASFIVPVVLGMFLGGYLGASFAVTKGNKVVKILFVFMVVASSIKLLFFS